MAPMQTRMFEQLFAHTMEMLKSQENLSHDQYDCFADYVDDSGSRWKRARSLLELCRQLAEEVDAAQEEFGELDDIDESDDESEDEEDSDFDESDTESVVGENV